MDRDDPPRLKSNKDKVRAFLESHRYATNVQLQHIGGLRAMARVWELKNYDDLPITVRKLKGGVWEIRLDDPPLGRDAMHPATQKALF